MYIYRDKAENGKSNSSESIQREKAIGWKPFHVENCEVRPGADPAKCINSSRVRVAYVTGRMSGRIYSSIRVEPRI